MKSPLSAYSDVTLLSGANEGPLQGGSTSAEISQLFLVDLIYTEYYRRYFEQCSVNNEKTSGSVLLVNEQKRSNLSAFRTIFVETGTLLRFNVYGIRQGICFAKASASSRCP